MTIEGFKISSQQARSWLRRGQPDARDAYCDLLIEGPLDPARLRDAVQQVQDRHECLVTLLQAEPGMKVPLQVPVESLPLNWSLLVIEDEQGEPPAPDETYQIFRLNEDAVMQAVLFRFSDNRHVLRLCLPSLCVDHRSFANIRKEIVHLYDCAFLPETAQFLDFSEWQQELLQEEEKVKLGQSFWRRHNSVPEYEPVTSPTTPSGRSAEMFEVPFTDQAFDENTLLGYWYALMFRLNNTDRLMINTLFQTRFIEDLNEAVGLIATLAPLTCTHEPGEPLGALIDRVTELREAASNYLNYLPVEVSAPDLSLEFEYLNDSAELTSGSLKLTLLDQVIHYQPFLLKLACRQRAGELRLRFYFDPEYYTRTQVSHLAESFVALLNHHDRDRALAGIPLLGEGQKHLLLDVFNDTESDYPRDLCLHQLFEAQVERTPKLPAVRHGDNTLTYQELNSLANRLARLLVGRGMGSESMVALCLTRTPDLVVAALAILKSGAAYLGIDPTNPKQRLLEICKSADFYVAHPNLEQGLGDLPGLVLHADWREMLGDADDNLNVPMDGANPAYVIFTSGSSGKPKGVVIPHRGVVNYLSWCSGAYPQDRGWGAPLHSSMGFDLTVTSLYTPLINGGSLVLAPEQDHFDALNQVLLENHRFSLLKMTPSHLKLLDRLDICDALAAVGANGEATRGTLVLGGEQLYGEDLDNWRSKLPETRIINEYGPTETVVGCCVHLVEGPVSGPVPIGRPIANTRLYVLDNSLNPVPSGVIGELYIGGDGLARGYLGQPDQTARSFVPDPFSRTGGDRLYRTGDNVKFTGDEPLLVFAGRLDAQVKVRGYRIELGEIDSAIKSCPLVEDGVVHIQKGENGETRLIAYICEKGRDSESQDRHQGIRLANPDALRDYLAQILPEYMIPTTFVGMDTLPLTPNGKVAYDQLPEPDSSRPDLDKQYVAPRNPTEEKLCQAWREALGLDKIGIHDNFFSLGGDSIRSVSAVAGAKHLGLSHTVQTLFRNPTIEALAQVIAQSGTSNQEPEFQEEVGGYEATQPFQLISDEDRATLPKGIVDAYPLSAVQLGMLFHMLETRDLPSPPSYHNVNTFKVQLPFDEHLFYQAVARVVARHDILRTSFDLTNFSVPMQLIHEHATLETVVEDLRHLSRDEQDQIVNTFIAEENFRLVDTEVPSMLHFHIHWLEDDVISLTLTEPHSLGDGWSTHLHLIEIFQHFLALTRNEPGPSQEPMPLTYRDFINMEQRAMASAEARSYWEGILESCAPTVLPPLARQSDHYAIHDHRLAFEIKADTLAGLHKLARHAGTPFKSVLLAAHLKVLSMICGQDQVTTGLAFNGRPEVPGGDELRGLFLNTMPFPFTLGRDSFPDLVKRVFALETEMLRFRRFPISTLQSGRRQLFSTLFSLHNFHSVSEILQDPDLTVLETGDLSKTNYDIAIFFHINEAARNRITLTIEGNLDVISNQQLHSLYDYFEQVLTAMGACVASSDQLSQSHQLQSFLPQKEEAWLTDRNLTHVDVVGGPCLHHLFEASAARTPEKEAVVGEHLRLTYARLNELADTVADELRGLGIGPGELAAVSLRRGPEAHIALLGILKAGAAYVPIDADNPPERIGYMLESAGINIVLTQPEFQQDYRARKELAVMVLDERGEMEPNSLAGAREKRVGSQPAHVQAGGQDLAYMIFTSGSTGRPKAVAVPHSCVVNFMGAMQRPLGLQSEDRLLALTNHSFDIACLELFLPLTLGATVLVVPDHFATDGFQLAGALNDHGATVAQATPSTWRMVLTAGWEGNADLRILSGGEPLDDDLAARLQEKGASLTNLYGPTETTIWSTLAVLDLESPVHIGKPIDNTSVHVLNAFMQPAPMGSPGELFIGGYGVTRGYHGRPELTAQMFPPDPFSDTPGARLYRTGDRVYFTEQGNLAFVGRIDFQVKLRGFRIEPGEIEALLRSHPEVNDVTVMLREDQPGIKRLVAYVAPLAADQTPRDPGELTADLRRHLAAGLPEHMVPTAFVLMNKFPLLSSGKLNRGALPEPGMDAVREKAYVAPGSPIEKALAGVWSEVLKVERVGIHDNFFHLGGDSINSLLIVAQSEKIGLRVGTTQLFQHLTIAELAKVLDAEQSAANVGPVQLTPIQRALLERPAGLAAFVAVQLKPKRALRLDLLQAAAARLVGGHEVLRLHFDKDGDEWRAALIEVAQAQTRLVIEDLSQRSPVELEEWLARLSDPCNPTSDSLFKIWFQKQEGDSDQLLVLAGHRLLLDDYGLSLLVKDLEAAYKAVEQDKAGGPLSSGVGLAVLGSRLAEPPAKVLDDTESYWQRQVESQFAAPPCSDTDSPPDAVRIQRRLSPETMRNLDKAAPTYQTETGEFLLTALVLSLRDLNGQGRFLVETSTDLRGVLEEFELDRAPADLTISHPLPIDVSDCWEPARVLVRIKDQVRKNRLFNSHFPMLSNSAAGSDLASMLNPPWVGFNFNASRYLPASPLFETARTQIMEAESSNLRLSLQAYTEGNDLILQWRSRLGSHNGFNLDSFADTFANHLEQIINHCLEEEAGSLTISDFLDVDLSEEELGDLLEEYGS